MMMKKFLPYGLTAMLILTFAFSGCGGGGGGNKPPGDGGTTYTGVAFTMVPVPVTSNGISYEIAQTEVTYELWNAVYKWALTNGYTFVNPGRQGGHSTLTGSVGTNHYPVTTVRRRDAIIWCNALTEYYAAKGGTKYQCVYYTDSAFTTPIRSSTNDDIDKTQGTQDNPYVNPNARGFRLPYSDEWYQAARYIDDTDGNGILEEDEKWYPDDYASGADAKYDLTSGGVDEDGDGKVLYTLDVAVCAINSTAVVKSKFPTALGLYDMSGNVEEWCFGSGESLWLYRCGSFKTGVYGVRLGYVTYVTFLEADCAIGFRFGRTH